MNNELVRVLTQRLDPVGCEVINLPARIWVFGGPTNSPGQPAASLRDCFWRRTLEPDFTRPWAEDLARPEDFGDWWAFSGYSDLLTFERDACFLARAIILFVESPGSFAELGCLASQDSILPQVLTIVQRKYWEQSARRSYLRLGPLQRVRSRGIECTIGTNEKTELPEDDFNAIVETIDAWLRINARRTHFDPKNISHILLIIADIVDLILVCKQIDIDAVLRFYGVIIDEQILTQYLELLSFFSLIQREVRGKEIFWIQVRDSDAPWVDHKATYGSRFVRENFKVFAKQQIDRNDRLRSIYGRLHVL
ncbi:retron St85 family effector protein [Acidithiobacillus ferriphilus]|uniref:retron St85 family effector protein n=1 Tax=Acidithiobacillus ferriphilus TaxID=1689834 RepID=UPI00390C4B68